MAYKMASYTYFKARKTYPCGSCGGDIKIGEMYCRYSDGSKECKRCIGDEEFAAEIEGGR